MSIVSKISSHVKVYLRWAMRTITVSLAGSYICPAIIRKLTYNLVGNRISRSVLFSPHCFVGGSKLSVGERTFINTENFFDLSDQITIGKDVSIGMRCSFITSSHHIAGQEKRAGENFSAPITIGDGCWIGGG